MNANLAKNILYMVFFDTLLISVFNYHFLDCLKYTEVNRRKGDR